MEFFLRIYFAIRFLMDWIIDYIFNLYYASNKRYISEPKNPLLLLSATSLAKKIKHKEVTSEQVVQVFIDRIKEVNGILNAVVDDRFEDALKEAKQIDKDIESGKITEKDFLAKPFLGVPFTSKESTICKGLNISFGLIARKDVISEEDAKVVELMKKAGGVLLGVTNIPQLNRWTESYNPVYGITYNPYNTTRNVGGSSGGEACIIAARGSPIGIGTDIGGSLRIPAHRCGIFGHKPTPELISTFGLTFRKGTGEPTMVTAGPMSAHSEDLLPLLKVLLSDKCDRLQLDTEVDVKKINVFYIHKTTCLLSSPLPEQMQKLVLKCAQHFNMISDIKPREVKFKALKYSMPLWFYMLRKESDVYVKQIMNNKSEANATNEFLKYISLQSEFNLYTIVQIILAKIPRRNEGWCDEVLNELKTEIMNKLGDNGVLLFPSEAYPAGYHYTSLLRPYNFSYYNVWNTLKFPSTQVPLGLNEEGLPVGIQVVAAPFKDHLTLAVAKELENAFGGYVPPFSQSQE